MLQLNLCLVPWYAATAPFISFLVNTQSGWAAKNWPLLLPFLRELVRLRYSSESIASSSAHLMIRAAQTHFTPSAHATCV